ncbi:hypothetical protein HPULCUR_001817 [Helicostylum pulchrum]|uniref:Prolamin-like domain-containing protein n=1 Tax=Helicostylum pulchrum TaxID=562976 RepID=A0ABP9XQA1_9FUNG
MYPLLNLYPYFVLSMLAKSLISMAMSLTLPLLAVCAPPSSNCANKSFDECLSMYPEVQDPRLRFEVMKACIGAIIHPEQHCFPPL